MYYKLLSGVRFIFGALALAAVAVQLVQSLSFGETLFNFFSFFTIQTNVIAGLFLVFFGLYGLFAKQPKQFSYWRGAITLYMTITGAIYMLLLADNPIAAQNATLPWVNGVIHYILPLAVLADWLIFPPNERVTFKRAAIWMAYPVIYLVFILLSSSLQRWFPYPFLNPIMNGWTKVIMASVLISAATLGLIWLLTLRTKIIKQPLMTNGQGTGKK